MATATADDTEYYKLDYGDLPDDLFQANVPVEKWFEAMATNKSSDNAKDSAASTMTAGKKGFPPNSLNHLSPIVWQVEWERIVGISLYMISNVLPFVLPNLLLLTFAFPWHWTLSKVASYVLYFLMFYCTILFLVENYVFKPWFEKYYKRPGTISNDIKDNQYVFTERNNGKYFSTKYIWPKSIHYPALKKQPVIFCAVPHGVAPFGITSYPLWSKVWNDRLCHWTCAPVVLKIPFVGYILAKVGYIPAKSKPILDVLRKKEENVGVILDGIAGMFHVTPSSKGSTTNTNTTTTTTENSGDKDDAAATIDEVAFLKARKGIIKIALKAGAPIIPVYGFGHTSMYNVLLDPFGILQKLSIALDTALTPFFGRWNWFLGPPFRVPLAVCLGNPVKCPQISEPTQADIDEYHAKMITEFQNVFETHKHAYGWSNRKLKIV